MSNGDQQPKRIRDRNPLIQTGYQGSSDPGANALAVSQPDLTLSDIRRIERQVDDINLNIGDYTNLLDGLQNVLTPDGYLNFDPIQFGVGTGGVRYEQATIVTYAALTQDGTATVTSSGGTVSYTNGTTFGLVAGDVVLLLDQAGTWVVVAVLSRPGQYIPPTYTTSPITGFPADGLAISGNGIRTTGGTTEALRCTAVYDEYGDLGLGLNVFVGSYDNSSSNFELTAYNPNTGVVTNLGFGVVTSNGAYQLVRIGNTIYAKRWDNADIFIYAWRLSTGWTTIAVTLSDRMSTMVVGGVEYLVYSSATGTPRWFYIDPTTLTQQTGANLPTTGAAAGRLMAKGSYMWTDRGHVATASFTPTWTQVHPTMSLASPMDQLKVDIMEDTGELVRIRQFTNIVTTWGLEFYSPSTSTVTQQSALFTATGALADGEPQAYGTWLPYIRAGNGIIAVAGLIGAAVINPANTTTARVAAIWSTDGVTSARIIEETYSGTITTSWTPYVGIHLSGNVLASNLGFSTTNTYRTSRVSVDVI